MRKKNDGADPVKAEEAEKNDVKETVATAEVATPENESADTAVSKDSTETVDETAEVAEDSSVSENAEAKTVAPRSSRQSRHGVISGVVHVMATFNNTKVTITDRKGNVIAWRSAGRCGFKGSRKSTAYAATMVAQEAAREATSKGLREAEIRLNGPGAGRESAARAIHAARIKVTAIQDVTPIPHNGCRPPKRRRV